MVLNRIDQNIQGLVIVFFACLTRASSLSIYSEPRGYDPLFGSSVFFLPASVYAQKVMEAKQRRKTDDHRTKSSKIEDNHPLGDIY
jgi:hypothetical protein